MNKKRKERQVYTLSINLAFSDRIMSTNHYLVKSTEQSVISFE